MTRRRWPTIPEGMEGDMSSQERYFNPTNAKINPGENAVIIQVNQEVFIPNPKIVLCYTRHLTQNPTVA
jgi:hypothetical protein